MAEKWRERIFKHLLLSVKRIFSLLTLSHSLSSIPVSFLKKHFFIWFVVCSVCWSVRCFRSSFCNRYVQRTQRKRHNTHTNPREWNIFAEPESPQWNSTCRASQRQFQCVLSSFHFHRARFGFDFSLQSHEHEDTYTKLSFRADDASIWGKRDAESECELL